jgi:YfiH family protein
MTFTARDNLRFFTFPLLEQAGVGHAILCRSGGVSLAPFASLNLGSSVGDDPDSVRENHRRVFALLGREQQSSPELLQVHSNRILVARRRGAGEPMPEADGWVTDSPEYTLRMRFADCVPVLLYDSVRKVAGIAHAGWKGTAARVAARAVESMGAQFGCRPEDILAGIGPSIGPDHYVVGEETIQAVRAAYGRAAESCLSGEGGATKLDLWAANEMVLREAGVRNIEVAGICTACHTEDWYSHRAEHGKTGRFGAMIWLDARRT